MTVAIDVVFVLVLCLMFFLGYRKGFLHKAWWLLVAAVVVLAGFFFTPSVKDALMQNTGIYNWLFNMYSSVMGDGSIANFDVASVAGITLEILIWIGFWIVIAILMAILKLILKSLVKYSFFNVIDKIFGGVYSVVICFAVLMLVGVICGTFVNFSPVQSAYSACSETYIFKYIFGANPFQGFVNEKFPLGTWIGNLFQ